MEINKKILAVNHGFPNHITWGKNPQGPALPSETLGWEPLNAAPTFSLGYPFDFSLLKNFSISKLTVIPPATDYLTSSRSALLMLHPRCSGWYRTQPQLNPGLLVSWISGRGHCEWQSVLFLCFSHTTIFGAPHSPSSKGLIAAFKHAQGSYNKGEQPLFSIFIASSTKVVCLNRNRADLTKMLWFLSTAEES